MKTSKLTPTRAKRPTEILGAENSAAYNWRWVAVVEIDIRAPLMRKTIAGDACTIPMHSWLRRATHKFASATPGSWNLPSPEKCPE